MATSISFTGESKGKGICSGACQYCSAASTMNYTQPFLYLEKDKFPAFLKHVDEQCAKDFIFDEDAIVECLNNHRNIIDEAAKADKEGRKPAIHVDIWYYNPLSAFQNFKKMVDFLERYFSDWDLDMSTSDNGVGIWNDEVYYYLLEHHISVQISHDGIGEWLRLPFDPLYTEPYASYWKGLLEHNLVSAVNCTLSFYNSSFFKNIDYWNKWLDGKIVHYIKLNHCYNADYDIKTINKEGKWQDGIVGELKGKPIGNWMLRNGTNQWDAHVLDDYLHEFMHLYALYLDPNETNSPRLAPYKTYIMEQAGRFKMLRSHDEISGSCRAFQRFKHKIGDPSGWFQQNFVITTSGQYSECNLISASDTVKNPGGVQPDYCKECKYELASECNICGSEAFPAKCEYLYRFEQTIEMCMWIRAMMASNKQLIVNTIKSNMFRGL